MTAIRQATIFDELPPPPVQCSTCGAEQADASPKHIEPVSGECNDCNHATVGEILAGIAHGTDYGAALARHRGQLDRR